MQTPNRPTHPGGAPVLDPLQPRLLLAATLVKNIITTVPSSEDGLIVAGEVAYFVRGGQDNPTLFRTDATRDGTTPLKHVLPKGHERRGNFAVAGNDLFFFSRVTDGTPDGTRQLADLNPGPASSNPGSFTVFGDQLIFVADDGRHGSELWHMPLTDLG